MNVYKCLYDIIRIIFRRFCHLFYQPELVGRRILVFGDSNSARDWPGRASAWPALLARRYGSQITVINESLDGRTTGFDEGSFNALNSFVPILTRHLPLDWVLIQLGTNDYKSFYAVNNTYDVIQRLQQLVDDAVELDLDSTRVVLVTPPPLGPNAQGELACKTDMISHFAQSLRDYCATHNIPVLDLHSKLTIRHHLGADHVHLNARGRKRTAILADAVLKRVALPNVRKKTGKANDTHD